MKPAMVSLSFSLFLVPMLCVETKQIDATDKQIDQLVYQLYDLTEEEIEIVEESV